MGNAKIEAGSVKGCWILRQEQGVLCRADGENLNVTPSLGSLAPKLLSVASAWVLCGVEAGDAGSFQSPYLWV